VKTLVIGWFRRCLEGIESRSNWGYRPAGSITGV
jgi:hypothetical protein